ncbi:MAG: o-succinylbenzoate--CoA ligase [Chloroflexota bacterium]
MEIRDWGLETGDWLTARVGRSPQVLALVWEGRRWSYGALAREVEVYAANLAWAGVEAGQHVAVLLPNGPPYVFLVHALARLGAVLVPLNRRLTTAELRWQVAQADSTLLLYGDETAAEAEALAEVCATRHVAELARATEATAPAHPFSLEATQAIVFTSGTTGRPKGAMLSFGNHFWSATASALRLGVQAEDRWLSALPLYHVGGLAVLFRSCLYGTAVILHEGFDLAAFNESLDSDGVTMTSLVPTMLYRLLPERESWPDSLRLVLVGGAATTPELAMQCAEAGAPIATTYGLTEASSQVATALPHDVSRKPGSAGKPLMFTAVRILDEEGDTLPAGEPGEIAVRGPTVMRGYYGDPEATAEALLDGELRTGDIGHIDEDGDLWLLQRRSDVIISGGENVYPAEVESVLREHDAVAAACVVGTPHAEWGQQVAAMVAVEPGHDLTEAELMRFCRRRLAGYKVPRRVQFVEALPLTASGKVARATVVEVMREIGD